MDTLKSIYVPVRLTPRAAQKLDRLAKERLITRSEALRRLIAEAKTAEQEGAAA